MKTLLLNQTATLLAQMEIEGRADSQAVAAVFANMADLILKDPSIAPSFRDKRNELQLVSAVAATVRTAVHECSNALPAKKGSQSRSRIAKNDS